MRVSTILLAVALALPLICVGADNERLRSITRADQDSGGKVVLYTIDESAVTDAD